MHRTLIALALAVTLVFVVVALGRRSVPAPEPIATLPDFSLTESDGSTITRGDLAGTPWVANFIFTRCVAYCPRLTARMKELRTRLPPDVRTVSISVDPEHDTPAVLTEYARNWQVERRLWLFLTGPRPVVWRLIREGFLLPVEVAPGDAAAPILHSNRFVLVDSGGRIRSTYEAFEEEALDRLLADLAAVVAEEAQ